MTQWLKKLWKREEGFSLIEAIVTVVILGAAVVPISMVFTRTIERTVDTRRQLEANELAQAYIEQIKSKDMTELGILMPSNTRTITSADDFTAIGLSKIPDGYEAVLTYGISTDLEDIALIGPGEEPVPPSGVDAIVSIDGGYEALCMVDDLTGNDAKELPSNANLYNDKQDRTIYIEVKRQIGSSHGLMNISYRNNGLVVGSIGPIETSTHSDGSEGAVRFVMGNGGSVAGAVLHDTHIVVDSDMPSQFSVYIYENDDDTVNATTETKSGTVRYSRNLRELPVVEGRIVEVTVVIRNTINNKVLATLKTTKFDE